jgi:hypothetical protein
MRTLTRRERNWRRFGKFMEALCFLLTYGEEIASVALLLLILVVLASLVYFKLTGLPPLLP